MVFDQYLEKSAPVHAPSVIGFIEENKANWTGVRVFDSMVQGH